MYNFNPISNCLGIMSTTAPFGEMHYIDQTNPANLLDEFLSLNNFDPAVFVGNNRKLVLEYVDRFVRQIQTACQLLGDYNGLQSCIMEDHQWGFHRFRDSLKFSVKFASSKVSLLASIHDAGIEYKLMKNSKKVFDREEIKEGTDFFKQVKNLNPNSHLEDNCFTNGVKLTTTFVRTASPLITPKGLVLINSRELEVYRRLTSKLGTDANGFTREVIMTAAALGFNTFMDHSAIMQQMALMYYSNGYYFYNHAAMREIVDKLKVIDYLGVGKSFQANQDISAIEKIWYGKDKVIRSQLTVAQVLSNKRAAERGKAHISYYHKEGDHSSRFTCELTEFGKLTYQTYIDIYKILESYVLYMRTVPKQLEVA